MADIKTTTERSRNMAAIRGRDTKPEVFIRKQLFQRGYRYRIAPGTIPGHPDLYMPKYNLAIFIHGCFWHRHEGCKYAYTPKSRQEFWLKKFADNIRRDKEVQRLLKEKGIRLLVVWECAIRKANRTDDDKLALMLNIEEMIHSEDPYREEGAK